MKNNYTKETFANKKYVKGWEELLKERTLLNNKKRKNRDVKDRLEKIDKMLERKVKAEYTLTFTCSTSAVSRDIDIILNDKIDVYGIYDLSSAPLYKGDWKGYQIGHILETPEGKIMITELVYNGDFCGFLYIRDKQLGVKIAKLDTLENLLKQFKIL